MSQKGLAPILIILILALVGGYLVFTNYSNNQRDPSEKIKTYTNEIKSKVNQFTQKKLTPQPVDPLILNEIRSRINQINQKTPTPQPTVQYSPTHTPQPSTQPSPTRTITIKPQITKEWSYETSKLCNVRFPIPPKKEPYYIPEDPNTPSGVNDEDAFWQPLREAEGTETGANFGFIGLDRVAVTFFTQPYASSGYIPGAVEVNCAPNKGQYTTQSFIKKIEDDSKSASYYYIRNKITTSVWGKEVVVVQFGGEILSGGYHHYIFTTEKNIFLIRKIVMSPIKFVNDTTNLIFENLRFLD